MTPQQVLLIQSNFNQIAPVAERVATLFYKHLFELDPSLRGLFVQTDMNEQGRKLMAMLTLVLRQLDHPEKIHAAARQLGQRHANYGVEPHHYPIVGTALLQTLAEVLGGSFTAESRAAWTAVYTFLSQTMQADV